MNHTYIVFVSTNDHVPSGGSEELWSMAAAELATQGHSIGVAVKKWTPTPQHLAVLETLGCGFFERRKPANTLSRRYLNKIRRKLGKFETTYFAAWLQQKRPDLVVFSMGSAFDAADYIVVCRALGIPYVLLIQNVSEFGWLPDDALPHYIKAYENAAHCYFVAAANKTLAEKMLGLDLNNASVVQNPYKVNYDAPFSWCTESRVCKFAMVASLNIQHKGHDILFEVLGQEKWRNRSIIVDLYGSGIHRENLERMKRRLNLDMIRFGGFVDDISGVWADHHALLMPSRMEGTPLALIEAMLSGRVPVVTDVGGNTELVTDGINGFVAKAPIVELFDDAMERAWACKDSWADIGKAAWRQTHDLISRSPQKDFANTLAALVQDNV